MINKWVSVLLCGILLLASVCFVPSASVGAAENTLPADAVIVIPQNATAQESAAADRLADLINRVTGVLPAVITDDQPISAYEIAVGNTNRFSANLSGQPDGRGVTYLPGDAVPLMKKTTTLYAIWKTQAELDAEQQFAADMAAANAAQAVIGEIGTVAYTDESRAKIDAACAAYDALTDAQKALVENYGTLTAAKARYAELKTAAETPTDPPTEPTTEPSGNNNSGKSLWQTIMEFFQRIADFFRRLFRI